MPIFLLLLTSFFVFGSPDPTRVQIFKLTQELEQGSAIKVQCFLARDKDCLKFLEDHVGPIKKISSSVFYFRFGELPFQVEKSRTVWIDTRKATSPQFIEAKRLLKKIPALRKREAELSSKNGGFKVICMASLSVEECASGLKDLELTFMDFIPYKTIILDHLYKKVLPVGKEDFILFDMTTKTFLGGYSL